MLRRKKPAAREPATVTIYATNDMHGVVSEDEATIGLDRIAGIAASTENSILVDAGDALQGASFATVDDGAYMVKVMNAAGYQAMAAGNHEFDRGAERLLENAEAADFPILSANTLKDGEPLLDAYTIIKTAGYRIGFIGVTTTNTLTSANPMSIGGVSFANEIEAVETEISEIRDDTDAIVIPGDKSPETYDVVIPVKTAEGEQDFSGQEFEISVDNGTPEKVVCEADGLHLTLAKGGHTIYLTESSDAIPVYVNNYSGSGTVTTADGYFHLYFTVDSAQ